MYTFAERLASGQRGESDLDALFAPHYVILPAPMELQRHGIDRIFTDRLTRQRTTIEYKTDRRASKTGNAFIETVSVSTTDRKGWAYTAEADWLIYYLPGYQRAYCIRFEALRGMLSAWEAMYPQRAAQNQGYLTYGLVVPLAEMEQLADHMLRVSRPTAEQP